MSSMVAEPGPIPSEKRPLLLYKEQIIEKIDENPQIQMTLETYESMSTSKQNLDIPVSEMMKQLFEVTETISQDRIQQCTLEQINDTSVSQAVKELDEPCKVLSRDRPQRLFNVIVGMNQDATDETRNTGRERSGNQTMTEGMSIDKCELSMERECDVSVLIKQICTGSDIMSQCVLCLSGMTDQLRRKMERCMRLIGTLQGVACVSSERGVSDSKKMSDSDCSSVRFLLNEEMSDGDHRGSQNNKIVDILRVDLQTLEKMESELFKAEGAQFVGLKCLIMRLINRLETEMSHISYYCNEETSMIDKKKENPEADVMSSSTMFTSPEVIDEAELENVEANRTAMQDTLVGKYQLDGVNTLEEMNVNDQMNTDKQNPDIAGETHINKSDLDDRAGDQVIMSEYASDEIEDAVPLVHLMTGRNTLHTVAATLDPQQFEGMPQAYVKHENDNTGGVSESQKCFQLGTQCRDSSSEHSTHEHDTRSTHIEHHHQDNMCITTMTDEELTNDEEGKMGKAEQGGGKAIHARYGNRIQAMTEKELRRLMEENSGKYVVYVGRS